MVPTVYKWTPMSKYWQSSFPVFKTIQSEVHLNYQAYRRLNYHLVVPVSIVLAVSLSPYVTKYLSDYINRLRNINHPLRLLTENEIFRLTVWANPTNDLKRGSDHLNTTASTLLEVYIIYQTFYAGHSASSRLPGLASFVPFGTSTQLLQYTFQNGSKTYPFATK